MKVINLFGGPGTGKSTTAAGVFYYLKRQGVECELVTEYAKDLVWSERTNMFTHQDYIFAKQRHRLERLRDKVEYVITDSPLLLSLIYMPDSYVGSLHFSDFIKDVDASFDNENFLLRREKEYSPIGRNQTEEEAKEIDGDIRKMLSSHNVKSTEVFYESAVSEILENIKRDRYKELGVAI